VHTFHGFAYELLEKDPMKEDMDDKNEDQIIKDAINYLNTHDIQLPYRVIMLDEFQDI
jgi:superfamily I DNA/RNA helicase